MQVSQSQHNYALHTLQSLVNSLSGARGGAGNGDAFDGQNLQGGSAGSNPAGAPPPVSASSRFAPASLAFLTSLQSSGTTSLSATSLAGFDKGLSDLTSALKQIQAALSGPAQTASGATASLNSASLATTATGTTAASSLTNSVLATALNELGQVLQDLEALGAPPPWAHHHHHHHGQDGAAGATASLGAGTPASSSTTTTASTSGTASTSDSSSTDQTADS